MSGMRLSMRVWDAPIRLFHWAIVVLVAISYVTQLEYWMQLHFLSGYTILTLLLFRLVWGFVGSDTARFRKFLTSPLAGLRHLGQFRQREADNQIGHNAAGGWMVLVMLALLGVQTLTGLFSRAEISDTVAIEAPLAGHVSKHVSNRISDIHAFNFDLILAAIVLHVLAILAYAVVKRQNLLRPMITGKKRLPAAMRAPRMGSSLLALLIFVCAAGVVALLVTVGAAPSR